MREVCQALVNRGFIRRESKEVDRITRTEPKKIVNGTPDENSPNLNKSNQLFYSLPWGMLMAHGTRVFICTNQIKKPGKPNTERKCSSPTKFYRILLLVIIGYFYLAPNSVEPKMHNERGWSRATRMFMQRE